MIANKAHTHSEQPKQPDVQPDPSADSYPRGPTACSYWLLPDKKICVGRCPGTFYTKTELRAAQNLCSQCLANEWQAILAESVSLIVNVTAADGEADAYDYTEQLKRARPTLRFVRIPIARDTKV